MTYLRQPRKDGKKPPAPKEIRCRSAVNIADDATMVVIPPTFTGGSTISNKVILSRPIKKGEFFTFALTERERELNRKGGKS